MYKIWMPTPPDDRNVYRPYGCPLRNATPFDVYTWEMDKRLINRPAQPISYSKYLSLRYWLRTHGSIFTPERIANHAAEKS